MTPPNKTNRFTPESGSHTEALMAVADDDQDAKRITAEALYDALERYTSGLRQEITTQGMSKSQKERGRLTAVLDAADEGSNKLLQEHGLDLEYAWPKDIVGTLIKNTQPVEVQAFDLAGTDSHTLSAADRTDLELGRLFGAITEVAKNVRLLEREDITTPLMSRVNRLVTGLRRSTAGTVSLDDHGNLYFRPTPSFIKQLTLRSPDRNRELLSPGILLKTADGTPTPPALNAASYHDSPGNHFLHVVVLPEEQAAEQHCTYALLRALNHARLDRYHDIFYDTDKLSPELVAYALGKKFQLEANNVIQSLDSYNSWPEFDSYEYVERWYQGNGTILAGEEILIRHTLHTLKQIGLAPRSLNYAADIGAGPNFYPAMLMSPYLKPGSKIDILEYSPDRSYLKKVVDGTIEPSHAEVWHKFERLMVEAGGPIYENCEANAKKQADIQYGDIFDLPAAKYQLITSYYVAESIVDSQMSFHEAIQSLARALTLDGLLIVAHMVGSDGWVAGEGTHFPAISLDMEQIRQAYLDADLEIVSAVEAGMDHDSKPRPGYESFGLIVAQPRAH